MSQASCLPESGRKTFMAHRSVHPFLQIPACLEAQTTSHRVPAAQHPTIGSTRRGRRWRKGRGWEKVKGVGKGLPAPPRNQQPHPRQARSPRSQCSTKTPAPPSFPCPPALPNPPFPQQQPHTARDPAPKHPPHPAPGLYRGQGHDASVCGAGTPVPHTREQQQQRGSLGDVVSGSIPLSVFLFIFFFF